jgi:DNA replication initiation complex subunit (GINS family)
MYNELYTAWRREIDQPSLGGLPANFYSRLSEYLKRISQENLQDNKSVKANLLEHETQNVVRMLNELLTVRYRKLLDIITQSQKVPTELLTIEEVKMSENFMAFSSSYQKFSRDLMQGQTLKIEASSAPRIEAQTETKVAPLETKPVAVQTASTHKRAVLRFTKAIPSIIGADMKTYGPFMVEDVASVPAENAKMLVKQGLAVLVEVS